MASTFATATRADVRRRIALVPQEPVIFATSVLENVRYGRPQATEREVRAALEAAHARSSSTACRRALRHELGERGVRLSGGQRQRLSIARALLADREILLLDEATSALDAASERLVQQALQALMRGRTSIAIAHRLSTVRDADRIVVIEQRPHPSRSAATKSCCARTGCMRISRSCSSCMRCPRWRAHERTQLPCAVSSPGRPAAFTHAMSIVRRIRRAMRTACAALAAPAVVLLTGCGPMRDLASPSAPDLSAEWKTLLDELRAFERSLGFRETRNFAQLTDERDSYAYCGQASNQALPYSYEDPAIRWLEQIDAEQCRDAGPDNDWYFGSVEVWGEIGTPVTPAMISGELDRFVYLVIHEDCHDQFQLPYGIEEPLCNIITYRAMAQFAAQKYRWYTPENRALRNYAATQSRETRTTVAHYREVEALYARFHRRELSLDDLMQARGTVFAKLERALDLPAGEMNNISLASHMTYSRHYGRLEGVVDAPRPGPRAGGTYFRAIDAAKPTPEELMRKLSTSDRKSLEFVRANEDAVIRTIERAGRQRTAELR